MKATNICHAKCLSNINLSSDVTNLDSTNNNSSYKVQAQDWEVPTLTAVTSRSPKDIGAHVILMRVGKGFPRTAFLPVSYCLFTVLGKNYSTYTVLAAFHVHCS